MRTTPPSREGGANVEIDRIAGQHLVHHSPPPSQVTYEAIAWQRFRAAAFRHDLEHSAGSWIEKQTCCSEWSVLFLGLEGV